MKHQPKQQHKNPPSEKPKLLDQVRHACRLRHLAWRTEQSYCHWIKRFIFWSGVKHPATMGEAEVTAFLSHLANDRNVSASTQNQALNALLFLYKNVLLSPLGNIDAVRAKKPRRLPVVLSRDECQALLGRLTGTSWLIASLLYGCGLRVTEALRLRVQDIDFAAGTLMIRDGKGGKDRVAALPRTVSDPLRRHIAASQRLYQADVNDTVGVSLPDPVANKYPRFAVEWPWYYVFPARKRCAHPRTGEIVRHHLHESAVQKEIKRAAREAGILKRVTPHTLRHSFATQLLQRGTDIRTLQELLGHASVKTTMIYTHVTPEARRGVVSPMDWL